MMHHRKLAAAAVLLLLACATQAAPAEPENMAAGPSGLLRRLLGSNLLGKGLGLGLGGGASSSEYQYQGPFAAQPLRQKGVRLSCRQHSWTTNSCQCDASSGAAAVSCWAAK